MIIVKLMGGLGNQLFQYAAARRLSIHHNTPLKLDIGFFKNDLLRSYDLSHFCIQGEFASTEEIAALKWAPRNSLTKFSLVYRPIHAIERNFRRSIFYERKLRPYDPNILNTPPNVYLDGYWQSEKYFSDVEGIIGHEFTFRDVLDDRNRKVAEEISNTQSVSVHIRRGDLVSDPKNRIFASCSQDYYYRCAAMIAERVANPHFYIFSDDSNWVKANLHLDDATTFVTHNDAAKAHEDLRLMSLCKHHIIANSSFSWWGAWLGTNPNKVVFAPNRWFNDPSFDTRDLIPSTWIKL